jgi:hypothetical protein
LPQSDKSDFHNESSCPVSIGTDPTEPDADRTHDAFADYHRNNGMARLPPIEVVAEFVAVWEHGKIPLVGRRADSDLMGTTFKRAN